jgi:hypothetical protein
MEKPLLFEVYMHWYLNQEQVVRSMYDRLFQNHQLYISNSKRKVSKITVKQIRTLKNLSCSNSFK